MGAALVVTLVTGAGLRGPGRTAEAQSPRDKAEDTGSAAKPVIPRLPYPPMSTRRGPDRESGDRIRPPRAD